MPAKNHPDFAPLPHKTPEPGAGMLLVSSVDLLDPTFQHTVVLLCAHSPQGAFGLILNRPTELIVGDLDEKLAAFRDPLYQGGPVQVNTLHFIHSQEIPELESREVFPGVFWGQNYKKLAEYIQHHTLKPGTFKFCAGFSGWGEGQLENEMKYNSWYLTPATPDVVFFSASAAHWGYTLKSMGPEYAKLADQ